MANKKKAKKVSVSKPRSTRVSSKIIETRHISELSVKDRNYLEELLRLDPGAITPVELEHLKARSAYLNTDERKKYNI